MFSIFCVTEFSIILIFVKKIGIKKSKQKSGFLLLCVVLFILLIAAFTVITFCLIDGFKPQSNHHIQPSLLRMGFFNSTEISQIQTGTYVKTDTFEQQIIGNLGDVIFSSTIVRDGRTCIAYHHRCNQLLSNYTLILIQEIIPNQVQVAWAGLRNCYTNIKFELTYDPSLYPEAPENFS